MKYRPQLHHCWLGIVAFASLGADWPQFRGPDQTGSAGEANGPSELTEKTLDWKIKLSGHSASGPIVVRGNIYLTASSGAKQDRLHVLCLDAETGQTKWERQFWATGRTLCHPTSAVAAPTPCSDGERIFAFYSSNDLICLDLDGNLQWYRGLTWERPAASNDVGMASSPVVVNGVVVVQIENQGDSFAAGFDAATGKTRWQLPRTRAATWSSPAILRGASRSDDCVLLQNALGLAAVNPASGEVRWEYKAKCKDIASVVAHAGTVYIPGDTMVALKPDSGGNDPKVLWKGGKLTLGANSPTIHQGKIYTVNRASVLACADLAKGEVQWQTRVVGHFWATPLAAGNRLYAANSDGLLQTVTLGEKGEKTSEYNLGEVIQGTPAFADGAVFVRSATQLWRFSGGAK